MSRSTQTTQRLVGGSTVHGTYYRTRRHHGDPGKRADIERQLSELWLEGDSDAAHLDRS